MSEGVLPVLTGNLNGHSAVRSCGEVIVVSAVAGQGDDVIALHQVLGVLLRTLRNLHRDLEGGCGSAVVADLDQGGAVHQHLHHAIFSIVTGAIDDGVSALTGNHQILILEGIHIVPAAAVIVGLQLIPDRSASGDLDGLGGTIRIQQLHRIVQAALGMSVEALVAQVNDGRNFAGLIPAVVLDHDGDLVACLDFIGLVERRNSCAIDLVQNAVAQIAFGALLAVVQQLHDGNVDRAVLFGDINILQILSHIVLAQIQLLCSLNLCQLHSNSISVSIHGNHLNGDLLTGGDIHPVCVHSDGLAIHQHLHPLTLIEGVSIDAAAGAVLHACQVQFQTAIRRHSVNISCTGSQRVAAQNQSVLGIGVNNQTIALVSHLFLRHGEGSLACSGGQFGIGDLCSCHGVGRLNSSGAGGSSGIVRNSGDGCSVDIVAHLTDLNGHVLALDLIIGQMPDLIGGAIIGGQIQCAVLAHHQGGVEVIHSAVAGEVQHQVALGDVVQGVHTAAFHIVDPEVPNVAIIIQQHQMLGLVHIAFLIHLLFIAHRGDAHQVVGHIAQVETHSVQAHGILGRQQIIVISTGDPFLIMDLGEVGIVGHIPHRNAHGILSALQHGAISAHLVHCPLIILIVHHIEDIQASGVGSGGHGLVQRSASGPAFAGGHIPVEEHRVTFGISGGAVDGHIQDLHIDSALRIEIGIQIRSGTDGSSASADTGDHALLVHGCDGLIGAAPGNGAVDGGPGHHIGSQLCAGATDDIHFVPVQLHANDLIGGICPAAADTGAIGDHQAGHFVPEVLIAGEFAGCGVDLVVVSKGDVRAHQNLAVGVPANHTGIGVVFHTHIAGGAAHICAGDGIACGQEGIIHQQHGLIHGLQREGIDLAGAQLVAVEHTVSAAGQRIGVQANGADLGDLTGELVDGKQFVLIVDGINFTVRQTIGHIVHDLTHIGDEGGVRQVVLGHHVQVALVGRRKDKVLRDSGCVVDVICICHTVGTHLVIVHKVLIEAAPVTVCQVVGHHGGQVSLFTDLHFQQIGSSVHGIVEDLNQELLAIDLVQGEGVLGHLALFDVLLCAGLRQASGAGLIIQTHSGDVLVVGGSDGHGVVQHIDADTQQFGSGVVDGPAGADAGAAAQCIPVHITLGIDVILGHQSELHRNAVILGCIAQGEVGLQEHTAVLPAQHTVVVGHIGSAGQLIHNNFAGGLIDHGDTGLVSVTDGDEADTVHCVGGVHCVTLGHIYCVGHQGVAAEAIVVTGIPLVNDLKIVATGSADIRDAGILASGVGGPLTHIEHRRIGPVAEEAQNGDGVTGAGLARSVLSLSIQESLQVSTVRIQLIQRILGALGQAELHTDLHCAVSGQHSGGGGQIAQEQICIVGVHIAVAVHIRLIHIGQCSELASGVIQQCLAVCSGDFAVAVEVQAIHIHGSQAGAAHSPEDVHRDQGGGVVHIQVGAVGHQTLDEEVSAQIQHLFLIFQVEDGEGCAVSTDPVRIVKQFHLNLAVSSAGIGSFAHYNVGVGSDSRPNIGQACALLQHGVVNILRSLQGHCGGHQQALDQMTLVHTGLFSQAVLPDILCHQRSHTGHLGRSHGGTGHNLITAAGGFQAIEGIDVAAGGSNLRLHFQRARHTPGGEVGHSVVVAAELTHTDAGADGHLTSQIQHIAGCVSHRSGQRTDGLTLRHSNGSNRVGVQVLRQVQVDDTALVVVNKHSSCAGLDGQIGLLGKVGLTTGAKCNLAGQHICHSSPVLSLAHAVDEDVLILAGNLTEEFIAELAISVVFIVDKHIAIDINVETNHTVVLNGSDAQRVGERTGLTNGILADIGMVQIAPVFSILRPGAGVTGRDGHHNAGLRQIVHNGLEHGVGVGATAGGNGTQRQVDDISAQDHSVLNGSHIVGVIRRAVLAEDLHGQQLRIGGHALHKAVLQRLAVIAGGAAVQPGVGGGDTGNVGAVLTLFVIVVGDIVVGILIVEAEGQLGVEISLGGIQIILDVQLIRHCCDLLCIQQIQRSDVFLIAHTGFFCQQSQRILKSHGIQALVIGVRAGVDDRNTGASAGVAGGPSHSGADLVAGGSHMGGNITSLSAVGQVLALQHHALNAGQAFNDLDLAILHIGRNNIGGQGQIPNHIQLIAGDGLNLLDHSDLILLEALTVGHCSLVGCNVHRAEASFNGGSLFHNDGYADHISVCVVVFRCLFCPAARLQAGRNFTVVNTSEADIGFSGLVAVAGDRHTGQHIACQHCHDQQHAQKPLEEACVFHMLSPYIDIYITVESGCFLRIQPSYTELWLFPKGLVPKPLHLGPGFRICGNLLMQALQGVASEIIIGSFQSAAVKKSDAGHFVLGVLIEPPCQGHRPT